MKAENFLHITIVNLISIILLTGYWLLDIQAQETPPAGYNDSCEADARYYEYFGPYCLNPVTWNQANIVPNRDIQIDDWIWFTNEYGETDGGVVKGYTWDFVEGRYYYWTMVQMPYDGFGGAYERIAPERVIATNG